MRGLLLFVLLMSVAVAEDEIGPERLKVLEFPDLATTLWSEALEIPKVTAAGVLLPVNFDPDEKYPALFFMGGAQGDSGFNPKKPRAVVGDEGWISVVLPQFKKDLEPMQEDEKNKWSRLFIDTKEGPYIWRQYEPMLEQIFAEFPGIDRDRTVFGGFSNGANTTAALLSNKESAEGLLYYVRNFIFVEGGMRIEPAVSLENTAFLLMQGTKDGRKLLAEAAPRLEAAGADVTLLDMPDTGHGFPENEEARAREWLQDHAASTRDTAE